MSDDDVKHKLAKAGFEIANVEAKTVYPGPPRSASYACDGLLSKEVLPRAVQHKTDNAVQSTLMVKIMSN
jgi:hypothetical protein